MEQHAVTRFADALVALAEGRTDPQDWLAWWGEHAAEVEAVCPRGWFLRLTPRGGAPDDPLWIEQAVVASQDGACYVLDKIGFPIERSPRYSEAFETAMARWIRECRAETKRRAAELRPLIDGLAEDFPKMARFLRVNPDEVESMLPGASEAELPAMALPAAYRRFLVRTRELVIGDTLRLTRDHPFVHTSTKVVLPTEGMLCFGEYWFEADGDQVLFDLRDGVVDDPPVLYYAHGRRTVERIGKTFTGWIESLPRKLA
ncbi:SMI1/KNR4 family protein [Actinophytocola sp.]|uniref:SMI1/KNR4 family protein n=1 Tax=Actinophytocola sp. TaxID=1872138 RepID=UPI002ED5FA60